LCSITRRSLGACVDKRDDDEFLQHEETFERLQIVFAFSA